MMYIQSQGVDEICRATLAIPLKSARTVVMRASLVGNQNLPSSAYARVCHRGLRSAVCVGTALVQGKTANVHVLCETQW